MVYNKVLKLGDAVSSINFNTKPFSALGSFSSDSSNSVVLELISVGVKLEMNSRVTNWLKEELKGLPVRVETWVLANFSWKRALKSLGKFVLFVLTAAIIGGVIQGESFDLWKKVASPWLSKEHLLVGGWTLLCFSFGWIALIPISALMVLIYGADRRRLGTLETVGAENTRREQQVNSLNTQVGDLQSENERVTLELERLKVGYLRSESMLLDALVTTNRELLWFIDQGKTGENDKKAFYETAFRRMFELLGDGNNRFRACVYIPEPTDPDLLVIDWDCEVGEVSRRWNKWYIGKDDPGVVNKRRGLPGYVYSRGKSEIVLDVQQHPEFCDPHEPPRPTLPYKHAMYVIIHPDDERKKLGLACIDSLEHQFTEHDLQIADHIATRCGWLMLNSQASSQPSAKGKNPSVPIIPVDDGSKGVIHDEP